MRGRANPGLRGDSAESDSDRRWALTGDRVVCKRNDGSRAKSRTDRSGA